MKIIILLITIVLGGNGRWETLVDNKGYFDKIIKTDFVLVLFSNSSSCSDCEQNFMREFQSFEQNEFFNENQLDLLHIDYSTADFFKSHYDLESDQYLYMFVRNQIVKMENFNQIKDNKDIRKQVEQFITRTINNVCQNLNDIVKLNHILEEKKIIGIYLGNKQSENYNKYYELVIKNIDFNFYYIDQKQMQDQLYEEYSMEDKAEGDQFVILRDESLIDRFDTSQLVQYDNWESDFHLLKFFEFQRYPKLRNSSFNSMNVEQLFFKRHFMMVYIVSETELLANMEEYYKSVEHLPKRMIYSLSDFKDEHINHYLHLFMLGNSSFQPGGLYVINVTPSQKVNVEQYTGPMKQQSISSFVFQLYEKNKYYFDDPKEDEEKQEIKTEEL